jgi:hypothetical protein
VLTPGFALAAALLAISVPSLFYAGTIMTENAFYPIVLTAVLALVLALERPTPGRVLVLLAVCAVAFATRAQAVAFVPALLTAPLFLGPRRYRWLYGLTGATGVLVLLVQALRGRSPLDLLGAYRITGEERYDLSEVARWLLYHVAELDLSLAVVPFAALLLLALVFLLLTTLVLACFGILSASFAMVFKRGDPFGVIIGTGSALFSGVFFPTQLMSQVGGSGFGYVSRAIPTPYGIDGIRRVLIQGQTFSESRRPLAILLAYLVVLLPFSLWVFARSVRRAKREGSLIQY